MKPIEVVDLQLQAYINRNIVDFAATYADDVRVFDIGTSVPIHQGKSAIIAHYGEKTFAREGLHAEIASRMCIGNKVIDHEITTWAGIAKPIDSVVVYEVVDDLIQNVWFFDALAPTLFQ